MPVDIAKARVAARADANNRTNEFAHDSSSTRLHAVPAGPDPLPAAPHEDVALHLLAAALLAPPAAVDRLPITAADFRQSDAVIWQAIADDRADGPEGSPAGPVVVRDRLMRAGHTGRNVHARLAAAVATTAYPERLGELASALLAAAYRAEFASLGHSLTTEAETASEATLEHVLATHRARLLNVRGRMHQLRQGEPQ